MATELDPNDIHAMRYLAVLRSERGAHPEAVDLFQTLISFTPNDQDLWDAYATCLRRLTD